MTSDRLNAICVVTLLTVTVRSKSRDFGTRNHVDQFAVPGAQEDQTVLLFTKPVDNKQYAFVNGPVRQVFPLDLVNIVPNLSVKLCDSCTRNRVNMRLCHVSVHRLKAHGLT